ncbi:MAG: trigger factor [Rickettsia endosymbiont of Sergentomyia squamirostris]|uniref:Trigger factor n=1 Tax=Candidatus Tisiphia endosymbiont of Sergentomyia squamirostris TaxID=3113639 RepID=A0AAT9G9U5_9RICK
MQVTELKNEGLDFEVKVVLPSSKIANEVQKELASLAKKVKLDGFRVGKVPISIVNKKYKQSVRSDVVNHEINHAVQHVIKDHKLKTVGEPQLENLRNEENEDIEFTLKFELLPDIELPDFKKMKITHPKLVIKEDDVNKQIDKLASISKIYNKESKGKVKKGQEVTIDAIGYVNNEAFEGGKVTDYKLVIGSGTFIEGFEDQLIGTKIGDEVEVNVKFPEDYHMEQVAGQPAKFIVQVKAVHSADEVVIDDEFAKKFNCETLEELRDNISKSIENEYSEPIRILMKMSLFDQLEKLLMFNVPKSLIDQEISILKSQTEESNSDSDSIFKDKSEAEISEYYNKLVLRRVRIGLMLSEYMKIKNLHIEQKDLVSAIMAQARKFPGQETAIFDFYKKNPNALERLKGPLLEEKTVQHIFDNEVILEEKNYTKEKLEEFLAQEEDRVV